MEFEVAKAKYPNGNFASIFAIVGINSAESKMTNYISRKLHMLRN